MQAIILAAGMGKRLKALTKNNTKCMIKVNDVSLIDRMLHQIDAKKLKRIIIVVGYEGQKLIDYIGTLDIKTPIKYIENPIYDKTNNIYSLSLAKKELCEDDTLLFESDLIFEDSVIDELLDDPRETLALVDKYQSWMDGTCVKIHDDGTIKAFIPGKHFKYEDINNYYKTVNIYKFSKHFSQNKYVPFLNAYVKALGENEYYEQVLRVITMLDDAEIKAKKLSGQLWYEIDDIQDLNIAESIFAPDKNERVKLLQDRYGGYWRYPNLIDFCYLVNPYFPPQKLMDEIKASFEKLLTQYPSGMSINSLLVAKNFGVDRANIVVGNGAAELIKSLSKYLTGKTGYIRPTFEEYPNRYPAKDSIYLNIENENYAYKADDIIEFFDDKRVDNLVIVNPDNPSGNYIKKSGIKKLIKWANQKHVNLVIDESFVDFSDEADASIITQDILDANKHLYVVKSISKSYGVPGLRLGILASGDTKLIDKIKKDVSIWNINSFAEFYLQIAEKYKNDYANALVEFREERARFGKELGKIKGLRVIPSQANYFMIEITDGRTSSEIVEKLLNGYSLFIKDLSKKTGKNYIRVAIRNQEDNDKLIAALKEIF